MIVTKKETPEGALECVTFTREQETPLDFKTAVRVWMQANHAMTWSNFWQRLELVEPYKIKVRLNEC
jgi:hypothetical protein